MKRLCFCLLAALALARAGLSADPISDYDRRAAAALAGTLAPGQAFDPAKLNEKQVTGFIQEKSATGSKLVYIGNFAGTTPGSVFGKGYFRIEVNAPSVEPATKQWTLVANDKESGAQIYTRRVDHNATTSEKHTQVAARRRIGNVILTVALYEKFEKKDKECAEEIAKKFRDFLYNVEQNKLLLQLTQTVMTDANPPEADPTRTVSSLMVGAGPEPRKVRIRIALTDSKNQNFANIERVDLKFEGKLSQYVKLEGAGADQTLKIEKPKEGYVDAVVVISPLTPEFKAAQYESLLAEKPDEAGGLKLTSKIKLQGDK